MKRFSTGHRRAAAALAGVFAAGLAGARLRATPRQAATEAPAETASPVSLMVMSAPPKGAIVLYGGKPDDIKNNFYERYTKNDAGWTIGADGIATPNRHDITSKQEFGDLYVHAEFHEPVDAEGKPVGHGNSGICFQGRYEVQIFDSYGNPHPGPEDCGAFYSQKAPRVNAMKKPTEWQTYDIFFRAPRLDDSGKVLEQPRATVILNGVVVQNNEEFKGPTGIQYGEFKGMPKTGPLILQGDHDTITFRSCWVVPM